MATLSRPGRVLPLPRRVHGLLPGRGRTIKASTLFRCLFGCLFRCLRRWRRYGARDPLAELVRTAENLHYGGGER